MFSFHMGKSLVPCGLLSIVICLIPLKSLIVFCFHKDKTFPVE